MIAAAVVCAAGKAGHGSAAREAGPKTWAVHEKELRESMFAVGNAKLISKPWSPKARMQGLLNTPRNMALVDAAYLSKEYALKKSGQPHQEADVTCGFFADMGQAINRKPWGGHRTLTTSSHFGLPADSDRFPHAARDHGHCRARDGCSIRGLCNLLLGSGCHGRFAGAE